jgi:hypothetical protein
VIQTDGDLVLQRERGYLLHRESDEHEVLTGCLIAPASACALKVSDRARSTGALD